MVVDKDDGEFQDIAIVYFNMATKTLQLITPLRLRHQSWVNMKFLSPAQFSQMWLIDWFYFFNAYVIFDQLYRMIKILYMVKRKKSRSS